MRSPWLLLVPLAAALLFISPAEAAFLPPCCVKTEIHPGDPPHLEKPPPFFVMAKVRNREERGLEAVAEAPIPAEFPLVDAIGIPLKERPGVSEPAYVPARVWIVRQPPMRIYADAPSAPADLISLPPCCQLEAEIDPPDGHPGDRHPERDMPPPLVAAEVRSPDERALEAAAEAPIPVEVPLVDAIGIPLEDGPGVSEPEFVPTLLKIAFVVFLLSIGFWLAWRRRPRLELKAAPHGRPPLPDELTRLLATPVPRFEPVTAPAVKAELARELEPA